MTHLNNYDGATYLDANESYSVTIKATVEIEVALTGLTDADFDAINKAQIARAIQEEYDLEASVLDYEIGEIEVNE